MNAYDYFNIISARCQWLLSRWRLECGFASDTLGCSDRATSALCAGPALVLDTTVVRVLDREKGEPQMGFQNDNFIRTRSRWLAELRGNLAVQNPQGVDVISIANESARNGQGWSGCESRVGARLLALRLLGGEARDAGVGTFALARCFAANFRLSLRSVTASWRSCILSWTIAIDVAACRGLSG